MTVSTRTPEGEPRRCPVCGKASLTEPSYPTGDSCCPHCGHLLTWLRDRLGPGIDLRTLLTREGVDSLDLVELLMELEEEFGVSVPDNRAWDLLTVEDVIREVRRLSEGLDE